MLRIDNIRELLHSDLFWFFCKILNPINKYEGATSLHLLAVWNQEIETRLIREYGAVGNRQTT